MDSTFGANTHDFRTFKADGMVKNIKKEYLITFPWNNKVLKL